MAEITINSSVASPALVELLQNNDAIQPGSAPSYQLCKDIYECHPMAGKLVEKPVRLATSKDRTVTVEGHPEEVATRFLESWRKLRATDRIRQLAYLSRVYGIAAVVYGRPGVEPIAPIDPWTLAGAEDLYFNVLDPLNISGSAVTSQDPNSPLFQQPNAQITAAGVPYHASRGLALMCGPPIYISYTASAFGFVGRSVFQRALFPLKTFLQSMLTDDLVTIKAGLLIAKMKGPGSIIDNLMRKAAGIKDALLKQAKTGNVLSIDVDESIEALNLTNTDTAMTTARDNCIANIAAASDVPALLLKDEAFTKGFGEGTEDSKAIVQYIDTIREDLGPPYAFFDRIVQHVGWTPDFFEAMKAAHPEAYAGMSYEQAFYAWRAAFEAEWPSLMEEPDSERAKVDEVALKGITEICRTWVPRMDPENVAEMARWMQDNLNQSQVMFKADLNIDFDALREYEPPVPVAGPPGAEGGEPSPGDERA